MAPSSNKGNKAELIVKRRLVEKSLRKIAEQQVQWLKDNRTHFNAALNNPDFKKLLTAEGLLMVQCESINDELRAS